MQPYSPTSAVSSPAHTARPAIAEQLPLNPTLPDQPAPEKLFLHLTQPDHSAAGAAPSSPLTARPGRRISPAGAKTAYSRMLEEFPVVWSAHASSYHRSAKTLYIISSLSPAHRFQVPKTGQREIGGGEGGIQAAGGRRHHPAVHLSMVQPATYDKEGEHGPT